MVRRGSTVRVRHALFRIEFTKRVYDWRKGIGVDPHPPIARTIYVVSVDPSGAAQEHHKDATKPKLVA
jgi:hypothetical protein